MCSSDLPAGADTSAAKEVAEKRGLMFVAVETTGIHCRPVCWARTSFARNLESYARPQQNVAAIAPASAAVPKQLRFAQHGRALRQL